MTCCDVMQHTTHIQPPNKVPRSSHYRASTPCHPPPGSLGQRKAVTLAPTSVSTLKLSHQHALQLRHQLVRQLCASTATFSARHPWRACTLHAAAPPAHLHTAYAVACMRLSPAVSPACAAPVCLHHDLLRLPALTCQGPHEGWCQVLSSQQCVVQDDAQLRQVVW